MEPYRNCYVHARLLIAKCRTCRTLFIAVFGFAVVGQMSADDPVTSKTGANNESAADLREWNLSMTIRGGSGMERMRLGWHRIEIQKDGLATVKVYHSLTEPIGNGKTIFSRKLTDLELETVGHAATAAARSFDVNGSGRWSEDGWKITLSIKSPRRDITITANDLTSVRDAGSGIRRLFDEINTILYPKSPTIPVK